MEAEKLCKLLETVNGVGGPLVSSTSTSVEGLNIQPAVKRSSFIKRKSASRHPGLREEKVQLCNQIADALQAASTKNHKEFPDVLGLAIGNILHCCDDVDPSIRLAAEESLNRILQNHIASHPVTILVDLFKEVKKNETARCMKAAWTRFAFFSAYIKPQRFRCRAFATNLIPCILQMSRRDDEIIHEALAEGLPQILKILGLYLTESEIKSLLKSFLPNLSSESSLKRRTTAVCVFEICRNSKKPAVAAHWLLHGLLAMVKSAADNASPSLFCGALLAIKNTMVLLQDLVSSDSTCDSFDLNVQVQVLRIILESCSHRDHNVQGFALEALHSLLTHSGPALRNIISIRGGLANYQLSPVDSNVSSDFSLDFDTPDEFDLKSKFDDREPEAEDISADTFGAVENPVLGPQHLMNSSNDADSVSVMSSVEEAFRSADDSEYTVSVEDSPSEDGDNYSEAGKTDQDFQSESMGSSEILDDFDSTFIGSLYDLQQSPLDFLGRYVVSRFLLKEGTEAHIKPNIRVSVQSLALSCLCEIVSLEPKLFSERVWYRDDLPILMSESCIFITHNDPLLKAHGAVLSCIMSAAITENAVLAPQQWDFSGVIVSTLDVLRQESAMACRLAVAALDKCAYSLLYSSTNVQQGLEIMQKVLMMLNDAKVSYWMIKTELFRLLRSVPLDVVCYAETVYGKKRSASLDFKRSLFAILIRHLSDTDPRIFRAAAETLCWMPFGFGFPRLASLQSFRDLSCSFGNFLRYNDEHVMQLVENGLVYPYNVHELPKPLAGTEDVLSSIIGRLIDSLVVESKKAELEGSTWALNLMSLVYSPTVYSRSWFGQIEETDLAMEKFSSPAVGFVKRLLEIAMYSSAAGELQLQSQVIQLLGTLFAGMGFMLFGKPRVQADGSPWTNINDSGFRLVGENLLKHIARLLHVVKSVVDGQKLSDVFPAVKSMLLIPAGPGITTVLKRRQDTLRRTDRKSKTAFDFKPKGQVGALNSPDVYSIIFESVRKAWIKHQSHLSHDLSSDKFRLLVVSVVVTLSRVVEIFPSDVIAPHVEELVRYLRITMSIDGRSSVYCIQQLLRCLFGCNLGQMDSYVLIKDARLHFIPPTPDVDFLVGFAENYCGNSDRQFMPRFSCLPVERNLKSTVFNGDEWGERWIRLLETRRTESLEMIFKTASKEKRVSMSGSIRQFESVVIKSLQLYTTTSLVTVQVQVLDLLVTLLQLRVNYSVLDGDHIFLKYVLKQVDLVEAGEIGFSEVLLPHLFGFLINLSHDKFIFQKQALTYGHIMQYCDSLMAANDSLKVRVLPILNLLFDDAMNRKGPSSETLDERDAQLEVVLTMALRCIPHPESFDLLHKFLLYQLRNSTGAYESQTRDLVEATFQRMPAQALIVRNLRDFDVLATFLDIVRSQAQIESPSFAAFFQALVDIVRKDGAKNVGALAVFAAIIDGFVVHAVIQPLFKLFSSVSPNHPLAELQGDIAATEFVQVISEVLDGFFVQRTAVKFTNADHQLLDYIHCNLLKSLTYLIQTIDNGPLKANIRHIHAENRLHPDSADYLPPVCRAAWMRFRYVSTGCDLESRAWNMGTMFSVEDHVCDIMWNYVRSSVKNVHLPISPKHSPCAIKELPFSGPGEVIRIVQDYMISENSLMEVQLLTRFYGNDSAGCLRQLFAKIRSVEDYIQRCILAVYGRPGSLSVHMAFKEVLERLDVEKEGSSVFAAEDAERVADLWRNEQMSPLKDLVMRLTGVLPNNDLGRFEFSQLKTFSDEDILTWHQLFGRWIALNASQDDARGIVRVFSGLGESEILTVMTDQKFSPSILKSCFQKTGFELELLSDWQLVNQKTDCVFSAAEFLLLQKIKSLKKVIHFSTTEHFWTWHDLAGAFVECGEKLNDLGNQLPEEAVQDVVQFVLMGFKMVSTSENPHLLVRRTLQCLSVLLENPVFIYWIRQNQRIRDCIIHETFVVLDSGTENEEILKEQVPQLFHREILMLTTHKLVGHGRQSDLVHNVILGLVGLPQVAEVVRIPPSVYKMGWNLEESTSNPIPVDFLQDPQVLKEFVDRICHYGWTNRRQFEEVWMALLSILSSVPIDEENAADEALRENTLNNRIAAGRMALRCITALLLESVLAPFPGNPLRSQRIGNLVKSPHQHLDNYSSSISSKRKIVGAEDKWVQHFIRRPRRPPYFHYTHFDGMDQPYCRWVIKGSPQPGDDNQIDLKSCLKFVMDLYSHWTSDGKLKKLSPYLLDEVAKSTLHLSNIFHDERNFRWMMMLVRQVLKVRNVDESLFYGHLIDAFGKAVCVMEEEKDAANLLRKAVETKGCQSLLNRVCCARVILRSIRNQPSGEFQKSLQWLMNASTTIYEVESRSRVRCGDVLDLLFTIFVMEIDYYVPKNKETINPYYDVLLLELRGASNLTFPSLNNLVRTLGRHLVDKRPDDGVFREQLLKVGLEGFPLSPPRSLAIFGFVLCCLDPGCRTGPVKVLSIEESSPTVADGHSDPLFISAMEKLAVVHQRLHKCFAVEEDILGNIFVTLLMHKMPLHEAINRVMAEFQSCQAERLRFVAHLVSTVFEMLKKRQLDPVVEEWISLSFCNFANRSPSELSIWSLACLFCAASSTNLTSLFPFLQYRGGRMDAILEEIFLVAGTKFFHDIESAETRTIFFSAVKTAAASSALMGRLQKLLLDDPSR